MREKDDLYEHAKELSKSLANLWRQKAEGQSVGKEIAGYGKELRDIGKQIKAIEKEERNAAKPSKGAKKKSDP